MKSIEFGRMRLTELNLIAFNSHLTDSADDTIANFYIALSLFLQVYTTCIQLCYFDKFFLCILFYFSSFEFKI